MPQGPEGPAQNPNIGGLDPTDPRWQPLPVPSPYPGGYPQRPEDVDPTDDPAPETPDYLPPLEPPLDPPEGPLGPPPEFDLPHPVHVDPGVNTVEGAWEAWWRVVREGGTHPEDDSLDPVIWGRGYTRGGRYTTDPLEQMRRHVPTNMNIVVGERTFGPTMRPGAPPSPFPIEPVGGTYPIPTTIERNYRREAERVIRDSAIRQAGRVIEGTATRVGVPSVIGRALGPIGAVIGGVIIPHELGPGTVPPDELLDRSPAQFPEPQITQPEVPEWTITTTPPTLPVPAPNVPPAATGTGASGSAPAPTTGSPQGAPSPSGMPTPTGTSTPGTIGPPVRWPAAVVGALSSLIPRSRLTVPRAWQTTLQPSSATSTPFPTPTPSPSPQPSPLPTPTPFTPAAPGASPSVQQSASAPPLTRTRTRTKECHCDPKPKKRKKARDCNVRGQLMWVSGPKKGKPAGSRCVNFRSS